MQFRADRMHGHLRIKNENGTTVSFWVPVKKLSDAGLDT
jgi:hypothetical protein